MKKIVALVLSVVTVLSLCTVAFAYKQDDLLYDSMTGGKSEYVYKYHEATKYEAGKKYNELAWLDAYAYTYDSKTGDVTIGNFVKSYFIGDKDDKVLYDEGNQVATITRGDEIKNAADVRYEYTAEAVEKSTWTCTTDKYDAGYKYVDAKGNTKYAKDAKSTDNNTFNVLVGTEIKTVVAQTAIPGQHVLVIPKNGPKELDVGVYEGYCAACHKTLKYATTNISGAGALYDLDTAAWLVKNGTVAIPNGYKLIDTPVYVVGENTTKDDAKKDGIDSAKTFDAGVAMYVGMSLLSVAGGAVVIGKKKEF